MVRAFHIFVVLPTPRSVLWPGWSLFARLFAVLPSRRPPHSVRGHGLGNRAAKQRHGTIGFSCSFSFVVLPTPSSAQSRGAARVIWLLTQWHRTVCFVLFPCDVHCFASSFDMRFRLGTPPSRNCGLCHLSISCWFSPFVSPPRHDGSLREGFDFGSLVFAPVFSFNSSFFVSPPPSRRRYAGGF